VNTNVVLQFVIQKYAARSQMYRDHWKKRGDVSLSVSWEFKVNNAVGCNIAQPCSWHDGRRPWIQHSFTSTRIKHGCLTIKTGCQARAQEVLSRICWESLWSLWSIALQNILAAMLVRFSWLWLNTWYVNSMLDYRLYSLRLCLRILMFRKLVNYNYCHLEFICWVSIRAVVHL